MNKKQFLRRTPARLAIAKPPGYLGIEPALVAQMQALGAVEALNEQRDWIIQSAFHKK